jgi:DNA-binding response OmpR family regulator
MIVEDDMEMVGIYRRVMETQNFLNVMVAGTIKDALSKFGDGKSLDPMLAQPEIVVCDNRLPDGFGIELSKDLLKLNPNVKIILATADTSLTENEVQEAGISKLMTKPFSMSNLLSKISELSNTLEKEETARAD